LWKILAELVREEPHFAEDFTLCFAGKVSEEIEEDIRHNGLTPYYINKGYISHQEAIGLQKQSQVLLLIEIDSEETQGIIPGKLFEYMISGRPILAIGPYNWDVTPILTETQTGTFVGYTDASQMKAKIVEFYHQFQHKTLKTNPKEVEQYSRKALTQRLAQLI